MEKPISMSVKEWLIKRMAINMVVSEKIIDAVVTHQFDSANDALNINDSIEISGFGKFLFNAKKAQSQYNKLHIIKQAYENILQDPLTSDKRKESIRDRIVTIDKDIKILKPRIK